MTTSADMIKRLEALSESCHRSDVQADLVPIREITQEELADTLFGSELPQHTSHYSLPLLNADGTRTGGFGYHTAVVDVYRDGTAVARTREWKYVYREDEPTLDGRRRETSRAGNHMVVRFYLLGCRHEYEERNDLASENGIALYSHDHYNVCRNCGHSFVVDSSD